MSSAFPRLCLLSVGWQPLTWTGLQQTGGGILLHISSPAAFFQTASRHLHNPDTYSHTGRQSMVFMGAHTHTEIHTYASDTSWLSDEMKKRSILVQSVCVCVCVYHPARTSDLMSGDISFKEAGNFDNFSSVLWSSPLWVSFLPSQRNKWNRLSKVHHHLMY